MAKQEITCDDILKELRAKQYRPVYYLMGEEPYYIDLIADYITDNVLTLSLIHIYLETKIEPRLLQSFKRIRKNSRNGLGIVYVQRDACGGWFNKIPPQRQLDIRSRKKIIVCEYCGRILIDPELAGIAPEIKEEPIKEKATRSRKKATCLLYTSYRMSTL